MILKDLQLWTKSGEFTEKLLEREARGKLFCCHLLLNCFSAAAESEVLLWWECWDPRWHCLCSWETPASLFPSRFYLTFRTVKMLEATVKISLIFPSTGWDWKEGWKRKEKGTWTQLPASGQPSQSHARSAQSSHYDRELPIPAFQTSKCHLPSLCTWRCPQCWACAWGPEVQCLHQNTTHSWGSTAMCLRGLQLHCCRICFLMSLFPSDHVQLSLGESQSFCEPFCCAYAALFFFLLLRMPDTVTWKSIGCTLCINDIAGDMKTEPWSLQWVEKLYRLIIKAMKYIRTCALLF